MLTRIRASSFTMLYKPTALNAVRPAKISATNASNIFSIIFLSLPFRESFVFLIFPKEDRMRKPNQWRIMHYRVRQPKAYPILIPLYVAAHSLLLEVSNSGFL